MAVSNKTRGYLKNAIGDISSAMQVRKTLDQIHGAPASATFTIGDEDTNVRTITIQLVDSDGNNVAERVTVGLDVCSDSTGATLATGGSTGIAASTNTVATAILAKKVFRVNSSSAGLITLTWTDTGTEAVYLAVIFPSGKRSVSSVIANT